MAITTSAGDGVRITSSAKNGSLPDQSPAAADEVIFDTDINTNSGNLAASPTFVGRKVILRQGSPTEEVAYITAIDGTGLTASLHQPWNAAPILNDSYDVSYVIEDASTVTGLTLVGKTNIYESSRHFSVGNAGAGGTFAYFALVDGRGFETEDAGGGGDWPITVEPNGRFDSGYRLGNTPVAGGFMFGISNTDGEPQWRIHSGGSVEWNDLTYRSALASLEVSASNAISASVLGCKFFDMAWDADFLGGAWKTVNFQGTSPAGNEGVRLSGTVVVDDWILGSTNGFTSNDDDAIETIEVRNVTFVSNSPSITCLDDKTWNVVNPVWSPATSSQADLAFSGTNNEINELFSFDATVAQTDGTVISGAFVHIFEGLVSGNLPNSQKASALGKTSFDVLHRNFASASDGSVQSTRFGDFAQRIFKYPFEPNVAAVTIGSGAINTSVALVSDTEVTQQDFNAAVFSGTDIFVSRSADVQAPCLLTFNSNSLGFTVGEIVSGTISGASGTLVEISESGSLEGKLFLNGRNEIGFVENEPLSGSLAGPNAASASSPIQYFSWHISASSNPMTEVYDYISAKMASGTRDELDPEFLQAHEWGQDELALLIQSQGGELSTERSTALSQGVFVSTRGVGTVNYMTDNSGTQYVPSQTVTLELSNVQVGSRAHIFDVSGNILMNEEAVSDTVTEPYTYVGDINITVRVRKSSTKPKYLPFEAGGTITSNGFSLRITQIIDPFAD
jgi:hypothetical protein